MAHAVSIPSRIPPDYRGLAFWMNRTVEELATLQSDPADDTIHDLRVALRRCRSVAAVMEEIDPHKDWQAMRRAARKLFRALGEMRDAQVMEEWLERLHPEAEPLKAKLLRSLGEGQHAATEKALHRTQRFDVKGWRLLSRSLSMRVRRATPDGDVAHCLALERLEGAKELHRRALRTENAEPWHQLRIGIKRFRYTVEFLMPATYEEWGDGLKRAQDLLGNIHDLDVLSQRIQQAGVPGEDAARKEEWAERLDRERQRCLESYRQLTLGTTSVWNTWMSGFPREAWLRYVQARIRVTRASMDTNRGRSGLTARLAMRTWSQLRAAKADVIFGDADQRRMLHAASRLMGIRGSREKKPRAKFARSFLLNSPLPPGWQYEQWEQVAWAIRYQRGPEPGSDRKSFAGMSAEQQQKILLMAGILRLAVAAQKCGVQFGASLRIEALPQGLLLSLAGVEDSAKNAARLTDAKRALERFLGKPLLIHFDLALPATPGEKQEAAEPQLISIAR